jgi:16S rRNA (uracil1498-N3)-methyltransferase
LTIPRIYSSESLLGKTTCALEADNLRYMKTVLRLKQGDKIILFDGFGHEFEAVIKNFSTAGVDVTLGKEIPQADKKIYVTLAQAIPKAAKMDLIVKSATELGVDLIIPFVAKRSVRRISADKASPKVSRWQKIAREASRCSRASRITQVNAIESFASMLEVAGEKSLKMIFWEEEEKKSIKDVLTDKKLDVAKDFFIIVGPEGGFSKDEIIAAEKAGFLSVSLGRQILKVETAAAAIISIIQYEKGIFSNLQEVKNAHL